MSRDRLKDGETAACKQGYACQGKKRAAIPD
jgi:hypothetical protein